MKARIFGGPLRLTSPAVLAVFWRARASIYTYGDVTPGLQDYIFISESRSKSRSPHKNPTVSATKAAGNAQYFKEMNPTPQ